ncbi:unnamed protein product [Acanthoscelides obtectus]|uniref:Uncharacterized protein n=1 Tax=Acanthoscelides obtectus TaxID=200917 RepID=A0A9P0KIW8_ACAOB|nr:unnamed protein product [Acanthoscelides obtectus]CAK1635034.1 hypothetical protein AOBTE_LOCUS9015 [Acanthoscelides obtectus]
MPTMIDSGEKVAIEVMRYYTLSKSRKLPKINALRSLRMAADYYNKNVKASEL